MQNTFLLIAQNKVSNAAYIYITIYFTAASLLTILKYLT